jgi:hypothetical protein
MMGPVGKSGLKRGVARTIAMGMSRQQAEMILAIFEARKWNGPGIGLAFE